MSARFLVTETPKPYQERGRQPWRVIDTSGLQGIVSYHRRLELALEKAHQLNGSYTWKRKAAAA